MARRVARYYPSHLLIHVESLRKKNDFVAIVPLGYEGDLKIILRDFHIIRRKPEVFEVTVPH
jgi:hypothetical protein